MFKNRFYIYNSIILILKSPVSTLPSEVAWVAPPSLGVLHRNPAAVQFYSVQVPHCVICVIRVIERDEGESFRFSVVVVDWDVDVHQLPELLKLSLNFWNIRIV